MCLDQLPWLPLGFEFLSGIPEPFRQRKRIFVLQAFIDDSGVKGTDSHFVLGGFIAEAASWAKFSNEWHDALTASPNIEYFKMYEASKLTGQFENWKRGARDAKLKNLVSVLTSIPTLAFYFVEDVRYHYKLHAIGEMKDPYFFGYFSTLLAIGGEVVKAAQEEQVEIIFDEHVVYQKRIARLYPLAMESLQSQPGNTALLKALPPSPMFRDDKKYLPLQAADMLAWLCRNAYCKKIHEFEWITREFAKSIPICPGSVVYDAERLAIARIQSENIKFPESYLKRWADPLVLQQLRKAPKANKKDNKHPNKK